MNLHARLPVLLPVLALLAWGTERVSGTLARKARIQPEAPWRQTSPADALAVVALGGMRGPYVDFLWYQSQMLFTQDRERLRKLPLYYGPMGTLQPFFVEMWSATGFNLAFNASAKFRDSPEQSWSWIRAGIERMREGIRRNPDHPRLHLLHRDLGWAYLKKCTPEQDPVSGAVWRGLAFQAWKEDPFGLAIRHFREMARSSGSPPGLRVMIRHAYEEWARSTEDPLRERELLLAGVAAADEFPMPKDPDIVLPDHRGRMQANADAALWAAGMRRALAQGDKDRAHLFWWEAVQAYERSYWKHRQFFVRQGGGFWPPPLCVNWPYAPARLAGLCAPRGMWERLAETMAREYAGLPQESGEECRILLECADQVDAYRAGPDARRNAWAAFAGLSSQELLARARRMIGGKRFPEAAAYLERIVRFEKDAVIAGEAKALLETLR